MAIKKATEHIFAIYGKNNINDNRSLKTIYRTFQTGPLPANFSVRYILLLTDTFTETIYANVYTLYKGGCSFDGQSNGVVFSKELYTNQEPVEYYCVNNTTNSNVVGYCNESEEVIAQHSGDNASSSVRIADLC